MDAQATVRGALWVALGAAALLLAPAPAAAATRTQRLAVVVGADVGSSAEVPLRYAESEALAFYELLLELGEVSPSNAYLVLGGDATRVEAVFGELRARVADIRRGGAALVVFYYSGHADGESLHLSGTALPLPRLKALLAGTGADAVIAFVDACDSGALVREKGLDVLPPFDVRLEGLAPATGQVLITSSGPEEVSLEADELHGSFFSHFLLSGLRGDADRDTDGRVTLAEAYAHCYHGTVLRTAATPQGAQHPSFRVDLAGAGDVVLTWPGRADARLTLGPAAAGTWLVAGTYSGRVVAELSLAPGEMRSLALPAQRYVVRKRVDGGYLLGEVNLTWGGERRLAESDLRFVPYAAVAEKGGPTPDWSDLSAAFWVRNGVVEGNEWLLGAALSFRRRIGSSFVLGAEVAYGDGSTRTADGGAPTRGLEAVLEAAWLQELGPVHVRLGGVLGGSVCWQALPGASDRATGGVLVGLTAGLTWAVADPLLLVVGLRGGLEAQRESGALAWDPVVGASLGLGLRL